MKAEHGRDVLWNHRQLENLAESAGWVNLAENRLTFPVGGPTGGAGSLTLAELKSHATLAHPADPPGRDSYHQGERRHVTPDYRSGSDEAVLTESDAAKDGSIGTNRATPTYQCPLVLGFPGDVAPRIDHVGEHTTRPAKHVVLEHDSFIDRDVVLDLYVVAEPCPRHDHNVLPEVAAFADNGAGHDMAEVPNLGSFADLGPIVDIRRFVDEIVSH
jgi:hypothetical protein